MALLMDDFKLPPDLLQSCANSPTPEVQSSTTPEIDLHRVGWISYIVNVYISSILCIFGFTGNSLILFVLYKDKSRSSNNVFLQALAVYDLLILTYTVFYTILRSVYPATGHMSSYYNLSPYIIAIVLPIAWIAQTGTIWFTTLVACDRYIAITYPFRAASICTYKRAVKLTLVTSAVAVLFNAPRFAHYYLVAKNMVRTNSTSGTFVAHIKVELPGWNEDFYHYVYHIALTFIFLYTVPLSLVIFFNYKLIRTLCEARKTQMRMTGCRSAYRQNNSITLNMIVVISKFILCQTPDFIAAIVGALPIIVISEAYLIFLIFKELLLVINSTVNFYIYLLFNSKFRIIMRQSCNCCSPREPHAVTKIETLSSSKRNSGSNAVSSTSSGCNNPVYGQSGTAFSDRKHGDNFVYDNPAMDAHIPSETMTRQEA